MSKMRAERAAQQLLAQVGAGVPIDVEAIAEYLNIKVRRREMEDAVSGLLLIKEGEAIIGVNALHPTTRQRFTLAHEIGHFVLHREGDSVFVDSSPVFFRDEESSEGTRLQEIEANAFASALLMPAQLLRAYTGEGVDAHDEGTLRSLAWDFEVSVQALTIRLTRLGLIVG